MKGELGVMMARYAQPGRIDWMGLRPKRQLDMIAPDEAMLEHSGLTGDHSRAGKRAVTLIQAEHLPVIAALSGHETVAPGLLRRNLVVSGINLQACKGRHLQIGDAVIEIGVMCAPCSLMETFLGHGGYSAMRGHGGWCASVIAPGLIRVGDSVEPLA